MKISHKRLGMVGKLILVWGAIGLSSCTYVTPEAENPTPGLEQEATQGVVQNGLLSIRKSFLGIEINQIENTWINKRKKWLCGWAPVDQSGKIRGAGGLSATPYSSRHCNLEFRISDDGTNLEAREMDVDYINDVDKWPLLFTIPIRTHYFYEKEVDARGRELNRYRKVSDRKNWQLAPIMDLDLKNIYIHAIDKRPLGPSFFEGTILTDVSNVELSQEKNERNFLAFNGTQVSMFYGSYIQHEMRFNFYEYKDNPNYKKTPYNSRNSKYMNILHILGGRPDGIHEVNMAAHWDISEPVEFCLNDFPEDSRNYRQIGVDVIEEMNAAMIKIKAIPAGKKAFVISDRKMKYSFDLRCPSITWVDDPALSLRAPLGIGLVNTNIQTGEILWGGAIIWGGLIDYIINRDSESVSDAMARNTHEMLQNIESSKYNPYFKDVESQLQLKSWSPGFQTLQDLVSMVPQLDTNALIEGLSQQIQESDVRITSGQLSQEEQLAEQQKKQDAEQTMKNLRELVSSQEYSALRRNGDLSLNSNSLSESVRDQSIQSEEDYIARLQQATQLNANPSYNDEEREKLSLIRKGLEGEEGMRVLTREYLAQQNMIHDSDNLIENHYYSWQAATAKMGALEKLAAAKSTIKNVTLHEFGHVVGLGHQFEGNILPEKGSIPDSVYNSLVAEVPHRHNYTSIMDYQSGHTEVSLPYEKVKMQIQDELTLTYLYLQKYASFLPGDNDFTFHEVPAMGIIPSQTNKNGKTYQTRYLPQCSDFDAWLATSPYCRRWDRGHDAPTIVEENLKEYTDSFISRFNSFTEATGGNPFWANYLLWYSTYNLMNSNRTFYDHMRYTVGDNELYRSVFDKVKKDEEALLLFSKSCVDPSQAPDRLQVEFAKLALQPLLADGQSLVLEDRQSETNYSEILSAYKSVLGDTNTRDLDDAGFDEIEQDLNSAGIGFTEVQKLCRASQKSLATAKLLLSLKGPDHPNMNYNNAIVPTGLRGGNATMDFSRIWGTYNQLGLLPVKLAALDVLTNTSSTMQFGWWSVGKPKFSDKNEGKFGYYSLYPEEFTDVIGTAVKNNMGFGGTQLQDAASMSVANLYMSYFLFRTFFWSNDGQARGFQANYIEDLKAQTKFQVDIVAVLLEAIDIPGQPTNRRFGFRPKVFNFAKRTLTDLPDAYALPDKRVIVRGNDSQIIMPLTKMRFLGQEAAYVWALEVTYDKTAYDDPLQGYTVKNSISELTTQELDKCIGGATGLASFFNTDQEFAGFQIDPGIATDPDAQTNFEKSLQDAFEAYQNREGLSPTQVGCEESVKGIGLITSTALSLNGFILPQVFEYIKK